MNKNWKRFFAGLLALVMVFAMTATTAPAKEAKADGESYYAFVAMGADTAAEGWGAEFYGTTARGPLTATTANVTVGETFTIGLTSTEELPQAWFVRPVIVVPGGVNVEYTIDKITIDGTEVTADMSKGKTWWNEGCGDYAKEETFNLGGGYNEWGDQTIAKPQNFKEIMYTITLTKVEKAPEYFAFVAIGADAADGTSWGATYYGEEAAGGIVPTTAMVREGQTVTIGVSSEGALPATWFVRPVLIAPDMADVDFTIDKLTINGVDVTSSIDMTAGQKYWKEGCGNFTVEETFNLGGGYNEWGDRCMPKPEAVTEIMYTITFTKISGKAALDVGTEVGTPFTGEFQMFLGMDGDMEVSNDWLFSWANSSTDKGNVTGNVVTAKVGDTVTLSLNFPTPVLHTWWIAPILVVDTAVQQDIAWVNYTIDSLKIDGVDVTDTIDYSKATKAWSYEGSADWPVTKTIRLSGGYNEWGDQVIASPSGCKSIEYTITITGLNEGASLLVEEKPSVDKNGTYHAYMGIQTDMWEFRNAWDDASYGLESLEYPEAFGQFSYVDSVEGLVKKDGTFTDVEIAGNGSYSLKFEGFNLLEGTTRLNLLFISTDIPNSGEITVSNVKAYYDGKEILSFAEGVVDGDSKDWLKILCANLWNNALEGSYSVADMVPTKTVEITFDVSGFDYDKAGAETPAEPTPTETPAAPTEAPAEPTQAPSQSTDTPASSGGVNPVVIVVIVIAVIAVAGVAVVVLKKKK